MSLRWKDRFQIKPGRWAYVPTKETLVEGRQIKEILTSSFQAPDYYYHLQKGGHIAALSSHTPHHYFVNKDIKNFFGSINRSRVTRALKGFFPYEKAREIAILSTVRTPGEGEITYHLPYGYPQSTIIASICLNISALGTYLRTLSNSLTVSVYVDDIIVSGDNCRLLCKVCENLIEISERSRLPFGDNTVECLEMTTAFNIELQHQSLAITPDRYNILKSEALLTDNEQVKNGILSYIHSVNKRQHQQLVGELGSHQPNASLSHLLS